MLKLCTSLTAAFLLSTASVDARPLPKSERGPSRADQLKTMFAEMWSIGQLLGEGVSRVTNNASGITWIGIERPNAKFSEWLGANQARFEKLGVRWTVQGEWTLFWPDPEAFECWQHADMHRENRPKR